MRRRLFKRRSYSRKPLLNKAVNRQWLYYLLPVVFWLLAAGGSILPMLPVTGPMYQWQDYAGGFLVAADALLVILIMSRIPKHSSSEEQCLLMGLLLGIAACWMPLIVLLSLPVWGWLTYRNLFSLRAFLATLIGYATVAVWLFAIHLAFPAFRLSPLFGSPLSEASPSILSPLGEASPSILSPLGEASPSILSPLGEASPLIFSPLTNSHFSIPVLSILLAWLLSAVTRHSLRER